MAEKESSYRNGILGFVLAVVATAVMLSVIAIAGNFLAAGENEQVIIKAQGCNVNNGQGTAQTFTGACSGNYPDPACGTNDDRLSCNDGAEEAPTDIANNDWGGANITAFNNTVANCDSVVSVRVCYDWRLTTSFTPGSCRVGTHDGDAAWSTTAATCPDTTGTGVRCVDVTGNEPWTCSNFFGSSGSRAGAMIELQRVSGGTPTSIAIDALYFNITYFSDETAPNVSILEPARHTNISGNFFVNASINDSSTVTFVNLTISNNTGNVTSFLNMSLGAGTTTAGYWNATIDSNLFRDGNYNLSINASDAAAVPNTIISGNTSMTIDNTLPNISGIVPSNNTNFSTDFLINASVNDSVTGIFNATYRLSSPTTTTEWVYATIGAGSIYQGYWNTTAIVSTIADGHYNITVNATDFAKNQNLVNVSEVAVDKQLPNITAVAPANTSNLTSNFLINASVNDSVSNVFNVSLTLVGAEVSSVVETTLGAGDIGAGYWNATFSADTIMDGFYNITANVSDFAGNNDLVNISSIGIDRTAANISAEAPVAVSNFSEDFLINASANDSVSGVFNATYRLTTADGASITEWLHAELNSGDASIGWWNTTAAIASLPDAVYNITGNATDFAGNQIVSNITTVRLDRVLPNATVAVPLNNTNHSSDFLINASVNDTSSGIFNATYRLINSITATEWIYSEMAAGTISSGYWNTTVITATVNDGQYNITVNATDFANNQKLVNVSEVTVDKALPNITAITPLNNSNLTDDFLINVSVNDSVSKVFNVSFQLAGTENSEITETTIGTGDISSGYWNATFDVSTIGDGFYNITANVSDFAGNHDVVNVTSMRIDREQPSILTVTPAAVGNFSEDFLINASVNDSVSGMFNTTFRLTTADGSTVTDWLYADLNSGDASIGWWNTTAAIASLPDAVYNITANATDFAGSQNVSNITTVRIDRETANVTIDSPVNDSTVSGTITINSSVNDSSAGARTVFYRVISENEMSSWFEAALNTGNILNGYWSADFSTLTLTNGDYNITANVTDFAGNQNVANISLITIDNVIDDAAPNATVIRPAQFANISGRFLVNASVNDTLGSIAKANVTLLNSTGNATGQLPMTLGAGTLTAGYWNATVDSDIVPDGNYNISVNATDLAGNSNMSRNVSVVIDNTLPNASVITPLNTSIFTTEEFLINVSANDSLTKVFNATFRLINPAASTEWVYAELNSGTISSGYWNATFASNDVVSGIYNITVNATDFAGNQKLVNVSQVRIDRDNANISAIVPVNNTNTSTDFLVNLSVNDSVSEVFNTTFRMANFLTATEWVYMDLATGNFRVGYWNSTLDISAIADGTYNISVNATDNASNQNIVNATYITIDRGIPNASAASPANGTNFTAAFLINASVNDSVTGVFNTTYRLINQYFTSEWLYAELNSGTIKEGYWNTTIPASSIPSGTYNITVNATDFAGNNYAANISEAALDKEGPNVTIATPLNDTNHSVSFLINASVNDSVSKVFNVTFMLYNQSHNATEWLYADLNSGSSGSGHWNTTVDTANILDGRYNITVNATDYAGNQVIANISSITLDKQNSNATIVVPLNNTNHSTDFLINASVNDSVSGVFNATYRLINHETATNWLYAELGSGSISSGYWNATVVAATVADGQYNITVNATDFAKNQLLANISEVSVDATAANATILLPANNTNTSGSFAVNVSANDSVSKVFNVSLRLINGMNTYDWQYTQLSSGSIAAGNWNRTVVIAGVEDGTYNITVNATDFAGNQYVENHSYLTIDTTSPNVTIVEPTNGSRIAGSVLINATINDSLSRVSFVLYRLTSADGLTVTNWLTASDSTGTPASGSWNATFDTTSVADGNYNITVNATDHAGASTYANISSITIANTESIAAGEDADILLRAQSCNLEDSSVSQTFSLACTGTYPDACPNDALSCNDATEETSSLSAGEFGGVNISAYNSTILNCQEVKSVRLCYEWTKAADDPYASCTVGVDKAGDLSWSTTSAVCPPTTTGNIDCVDITSLEASWSCTDFFGATSPAVWAYIEGQRSSGGGARNLDIDVFYFNVTYSEDNIAPANEIHKPGQNSNISGSFVVNASINDTIGVTNANLTISNNTGNATGIIKMTLGAGTTIVGYWNATVNSETLREGNYNLSVNATDSSGNTNISRNVSIVVDNTLPNASQVVPLNNTNHSANFVINASVNDSLTKVFNATFRLINPSVATAWIYATRNTNPINNTYWNTTAIVSTIADGHYNITVNATDFAGNQKLVNVSEAAVDKQLPNITAVVPANNTNTTADFLINASVNDSVTGVFNTTYRLMNSLTTTEWLYAELGAGTISSGYWNSTFAVASVNDDRYNVTANSTDFAGNQKIANVSEIAIDRTAANVSVAAPLNESNVSSTMLVNASVNDSVTGTANASFRAINELSSTAWIYATLGAGTINEGWWNISFDTASVSDGRYNITINATDFVLNQKLANITEIIIDNTHANATIAWPANGSNISGEFLVNAAVNDTIAGVANVSFRLINNTHFNSWNYATMAVGTITAGYWNVTVDSNSVADGQYNITINATDFAGTQYVENISEMLIDNNAPLIELIRPVQDANTSNTTINFSWQPSDGDVWVECNLTIDGQVNASDIQSTPGQEANYTAINLNGGLHRWNVTCADHSLNANTSATFNFTVVEGPEFVNASLVQDNTTITLNWSNVTYADHYDIYISDSHTTFAGIPNFTGVKDLNWTDNTTNSTFARFYKVSAVRSNANASSETIAGRHKIELEPFWNLVSWPFQLKLGRLQNDTVPGYDLAVHPEGCVDEIWRYNSTLQDPWEFTSRVNNNWSAAAGDENFTSIEPYRGYWLYNQLEQACNVTFAGTLAAENATAGLHNDFNIIAWPSEDMPTLGNSCNGGYPLNVTPANSLTALYYYNATTDLFHGTFHYTFSGCQNNDWGWWPDSRSSHFTTLNPTRGYYARASQENIWEIDPLR